MSLLVWILGDQGKSKNAGPSDQENKTKIVTKQAAVQKSSIPEITTVSSENKGKKFDVYDGDSG